MKKTTIITSLIIFCVIFTGFTIFVYYFQFGVYGLSNSTEKWAQFGDYFGGVLNPLISILNLAIFAYLSIQLVKDEDQRNKWTLQELVRPFAEIEFIKNLSSIKIEVHNLGLWPMIITRIQINDNHGNSFDNFRKVITNLDFSFPKELKDDGIAIKSFNVVGNHSVVGKEKKIVLLKIVANENSIVDK